MENAKIVLAESYPSFHSLVRFNVVQLELHAITRIATTLEASLGAVNDVAQGQLECDVLMVSNSFCGEDNCNDAEKVIDYAHEVEVAEDMVIIGFFMGRMQKAGLKVDHKVVKSDMKTVADIIRAEKRRDKKDKTYEVLT